jgi:hypothetical protein
MGRCTFVNGWVFPIPTVTPDEYREILLAERRKMAIEDVFPALDLLTETVEESKIRSARNWGGADVIITNEPPAPRDPDSFYPDARYVVTDYSHELSWLFMQLRDIFAGFLDGQNKIEFYGRLANMANRHLTKNDSPTSTSICLAVLHEAYAIAEEIQEVGFLDSLAIAFNGEILDDFVEMTDREMPVSGEEARNALLAMGIEP